MLSALMNQAMAIKHSLAGFKKRGADVSDDRFKELDENFKRFEKDFDALDVEEVADDDFRMTPSPWMSSNLPQDETATASVNPPQTEVVAPFDQYGTLMSAEQQAKDRLLLEDGPEAEAQEIEPAAVTKDAVTGEELASLNRLLVVPTAQP
ncbi:unnamed protein product [Arabis nemorensis]|uniref:Uncharacterized protein n=1 Tax=Arabis nemorensis TaxID=586526 RepID=A0A565CMX1_9BRAS|nr:unnamed protein product [Arabis nemorensis]